jgi:glycosyltransferase involved in cell wall biosynthesis
MEQPSKPALRLVLVISSLGCGGAERVMADLAERFAALGHRVALLTVEPEIRDFFEVAAPVARLTLPAEAGTGCRWFDWPCQRRRTACFREAILRERPDLVLSFLDMTNVAVLLALSGTGVPVVVAEHTDPGQHRIGWRWSLLRRWTYPQADAVVLLTGAARRWADARRPRWRTAVIPNAVRPAPLAVAPRRPECFGSRTAMALGRLGPEKGYDRLIPAYARLAERFPEWNLVIFGEGAERASLERLVADFGLAGRVHLPGRIADPERVLPAADLFVLPSRFEGFPMALTEAMAAGLPAVAFACSGAAEIIRDGIDGLLVPPGDVAGLAAALARLMADEAERRRLGERAVEVAERFAPESIVERWVALFEQVRADAAARASRHPPG